MRYLRCFCQDFNVVPDWAYLFLQSCVAVRSASSGRLAVGGMISCIVGFVVNIGHLSEEGSPDPPVPGAIVYDERWLCSNGVLSVPPEGGKLWHYGPNNAYFLALSRPLQFGLAQSYRILPDEPIVPPAPVAPPPPVGHDGASGSGTQWEERLFATLAENAAMHAQSYAADRKSVV